jgi:hypothetical protein
MERDRLRAENAANYSSAIAHRNLADSLGTEYQILQEKCHSLTEIVKEFIRQVEVTDTNDTHCILCDGWNQDYEGVIHEVSCVASKANEVLS